MTSRYLYAVIRGAAPRTFEAKGIGARGDTVYTITFLDFVKGLVEVHK